MKFYIASKLSNYKQVQTLSKSLKDFGWKHTFDWTTLEFTKEANIETLKDISKKEFDGVKNADVIIILTPEGTGTHIELGIAAALNKKIYICHEDDKYFKCDDNTSAFYWLPCITHFVGGIDELAKKLQMDYSNM